MTGPLSPQERWEQQQRVARLARRIRERDTDPAENEPINRHAAETRVMVDRHDRDIETLRKEILGIALAVIVAVIVGLVA